MTKDEVAGLAAGLGKAITTENPAIPVPDGGWDIKVAVRDAGKAARRALRAARPNAARAEVPKLKKKTSHSKRFEAISS